MEESQNTVRVKVKYQGLKQPNNKPTETQMVTQWHVGRIIAVIVILLLLIGLTIYFFNRDSSHSVNTSTVNAKPVKNILAEKIIKEVEDISKPSHSVVTKIITESNIVKPYVDVINKKVEPVLHKEAKVLANKIVTRALLAKGIYRKEPVGNIEFPLVLNKTEAKSVFYFTEIIDMKGKYLYHQWLRGNQLVYKRKINILGNRWRASTSKLIPYSKAGDWTVRLVNKQGVILNEIKFKAIK